MIYLKAQRIKKGRQNLIDELVKAIIQTIGIYPTGSFAELSSREIGIAVSQNPSLRLKPNVVLLATEER